MVTTTPEALARPVPAAAPVPVAVVVAPSVEPRAPRQRRVRRRHGLLVLGADVLAAAVGTALVGAALVRSIGLPPGPGLALAVAPALWLVLLAATGAHRLPGAVPVLRAGMLLGLVCWVASAGPTDPAATPALVLLTASLVLASLGVRRLLGTPATRVLLVGDRPAVDLAVGEIARPGHRFVLAGVRTDGLDDVAEQAASAAADAVLVLSTAGLDPLRLRRLGWELERSGSELYVGTGLLDVCVARTSPDRVGDLGVLRVRAPGRSGPRRAVKAVGERTVAAVALLVLAPVLVVLAAVVRSSTQGPAVFRQTRIGLDGRPFTMLKLRTMAAGAERPGADLSARNEVAGGVLFKLREDPRVTPVGRLLRRYSLDELPQLVNVLRGDMALVGPRPALPQEVEQYAVDPRRRLAVRPGLTGLWQVSGRSDLSWEETVRLDLSYVDNWSLGLDLRIVARTVRAVVAHRGAY